MGHVLFADFGLIKAASLPESVTSDHEDFAAD